MIHAVLESRPHLRKGQFPDQLLPKEDHPGHPEEEDVVAGLQQGPRVEHVQVLCLKVEVCTCILKRNTAVPSSSLVLQVYLLWPTKDGERKKS